MHIPMLRIAFNCFQPGTNIIQDKFPKPYAQYVTFFRQLIFDLFMQKKQQCTHNDESFKFSIFTVSMNSILLM